MLIPIILAAWKCASIVGTPLWVIACSSVVVYFRSPTRRLALRDSKHGEGRMPPPKGEDPLLGHPKYEALDFLGEGSFGFVLLARNLQTGEEVAIKFWPRGMFIPVPSFS